MNVYLFALDSVSNSLEEIQIGQDAILDQWLTYGNDIVLTMNQLTDSMAFLQTIHDESKYAILSRMIEMGKIKVNRFKDVFDNTTYVSPSHYLQHSLEMAMNSEEYHFSSKFIDENDAIQTRIALMALKYSNPHIIDEEIKVLQEGGTGLSGIDFATWDEQARIAETSRLNDIKRYIEVVLLLSKGDTADLPPKSDIQNCDKLCGYLESVAEVYGVKTGTTEYNDSILSKDEYDLLISAIQQIWNVIQSGVQNNTRNDLNRRSVWYKFAQRIYTNNTQTATALAQTIEDIVDICYNFALQYSVANVASSVKSTDTDFCAAFEQEYKLHLINHHIYSWDETSQNVRFLPLSDTETKKWEKAWDVLEMNLINNNYDEAKNHCNSNETMGFKSKFEQQKTFWKKTTSNNLRKEMLSAIIYCVVFIILEYFMNILQSYTEDFFEYLQSSLYISGTIIQLMYTVCGILVFGIVSSKVSDRFNLPDILDSFKQFKKGLEKWAFLKKYRKQGNL